MRSERGVRNSEHQRQAGGSDRITNTGSIPYNDDGGHLIATIFGGSGEVDNIVAMNANLNRGKYRSLEREWARELASGNSVNVSISARYSGDSIRPTGFTINYSVNGQQRTPVRLRNQYGG